MEKNPFCYSYDNKRYHTFDYEMKRLFGHKVVKVPLDAGFTCPNLDGSKGVGGCTYCGSRGAGEFVGKGSTLGEQFEDGKKTLSRKWPSAQYFAYFQAHSNTYAPVSRLRSLFEEALSFEGVKGLCIATRADLLPDDVLNLLEELNSRTFLTVELGLQTVHDRTAERINRCHSFAEFLTGYSVLAERGIRTCVHLINGLPGETREMMVETAKQVAALSPWGIKIHMLHILKGTTLAEEYGKSPYPLLELDEYTSLICDQLERFAPETVVERITGDGPKDQVIAPLWTLRKREVLAAVDKEFVRRGSFQGSRAI
jgi:radical SAM protein (TIGR01212 family)